MVELRKSRGRIGLIQYWLVRWQKPRLGDWGEWVALQHLLKCGFDVIARNWKISRGEVDLIAYDGEQLVLIEVKTRIGPTSLLPELNLDEKKKNQLSFLAYSFLARHELVDVSVRFDLVAIETPDWKKYEIRHYRGFM